MLMMAALTIVSVSLFAQDSTKQNQKHLNKNGANEIQLPHEM